MGVSSGMERLRMRSMGRQRNERCQEDVGEMLRSRFVMCHEMSMSYILKYLFLEFPGILE